jgi:hypothetical protein
MAQAVIEALAQRFPRIVTDAYQGPGGDDCAFVAKDRIAEVCRFLKEDPRRVLLYEEFVGHPLRKDYPLRGRQPLVTELEVPEEQFRGPGPARRSE